MTYDHNCVATFFFLPSKGSRVEPIEEMLRVSGKRCLLTAEIILFDKINFDDSII